MPKKPVGKLTKLRSWEEYMRESGKYDPKGNEAFYFAQKIIGYRYKNAQPPVPFDQEKADKEAKKMAETPYFKEQFEKNKDSISEMIAKEQSDKVVEKVALPLPTDSKNLNEAYKGLDGVQRKMADGSYGIEPTKSWKDLQGKVITAVDDYKKDPDMSDLKKLNGLVSVFGAYRKFASENLGKKGPEGKKMMDFSLDILTSLGGGPEVVSKNYKDLVSKTFKEMHDEEKEIEAEMQRRSDNFHKKMGWTSEPQKKDGPENKIGIGKIEPKRVAADSPVLKKPDQPDPVPNL